MPVFKIIIENGKCSYLNDPMGVYMYIVEKILHEEAKTVSDETHEIASEAQCWCELACVDDEYEGEEFSIQCVER